MGLVVSVAGFFQKAYCYRYPNLLSSLENLETTLRDSEGIKAWMGTSTSNRSSLTEPEVKHLEGDFRAKQSCIG